MEELGSSHPANDPPVPDPSSPDDAATDARAEQNDRSPDNAPEAGSSPTSSSSSAKPAIAVFSTDRQATVISKRPPLAQPLLPLPASPVEMGVALEGQTLGHYRLEKFVGGGGMGAVFRAVDTMLDRIVAVKVLSRDHTDEEILRRFKNEAQSAARLDHDNIARVHYVGEDQGWNYIVFEFIEGLNIRELVVQKGPLPLEEAINYILQVAEALEHACQRDVVHRDIKPSNVLVTPDGRIKLVDMGLARLHQVESPDYDLTASGVTLGTFDYISPEQARDPRSADVRSDLYSLGCTFYFMLTGQPPFPEGTVLQKLLRHTSDERPDPRRIRPELPEEIIEILNRMLAKRPHERYQRPNELIGELLLLADELGLHGASQGGTVWVTPSQEQPGWLERLIPIVVPVAGLITVVLVLDQFWPATNGDPRHRQIVFEPGQNEPSLERLTPNVDEQLSSSSSIPQIPSTPGQPLAPPPDELVPSHPSPAKAESVEASAVPPTNEQTSTVTSATEMGLPEQLDQIVRAFGSPQGIGPASTEAELSFSSSSSDAGSSLSLSFDGAAAVVSNTIEEAPSGDPGPREISAIFPRRLIVGSAHLPVPEDARVVSSLEAACKLLVDLPDVDLIELWFDGPVMVAPFELAARSLVNIRAGDGFSPEIVFRPSERDFIADGRMIRLLGGEVVWEGIHFRFEPPAEAADGWAMFYLDQMISIEFRDCTLTVANSDEDGWPIQESVAFFEVPEPPRLEIMLDEEDFVATRPIVELHRCIARGQATFVRSPRVTPFELYWEQGLFVTTQRLLETGGAMLEPWLGKVEIGLDHVTAVMGKGMCQMETQADAPYQLELHLDCRNCILHTALGAPFIEHRGVQGEMELGDRMEFRAKYCYFPNQAIIWRLIPRDDERIAKEIRFDRALTKTKASWFDQDSSELITSAMWQRWPPRPRVHEHTKSDYLLSDRLNNPGKHSFPGFDPAQLPELNGPGRAPVSPDAASTQPSQPPAAE